MEETELLILEIAAKGGLQNESAALCEAIRSLSKERLVKRLGTVTLETLRIVEDRLRILLRL